MVFALFYMEKLFKTLFFVFLFVESDKFIPIMKISDTEKLCVPLDLFDSLMGKYQPSGWSYLYLICHLYTQLLR